MLLSLLCLNLVSLFNSVVLFHKFLLYDSDSDILFNLSMYSYITQQTESLFDNDIFYIICPGDWTKIS